jgi:hypothetical protein
MSTNLDRHVRADDSTNPAPNAPRLIHDFGEKVSLCVDLLRHLDDLLRTSANAKLAAFASVLFYLNQRHGFLYGEFESGFCGSRWALVVSRPKPSRECVLG